MTHRVLLRRQAIQTVALVAGGALMVRAAPGFAQGMDKIGGTTRFVEWAAGASEFESAAGQLALQRSTNSGVRGFGQRMLKDHEELLTSLKFTNDSNSGAPFPTTMNVEGQRMFDRLAAASDAEFDILYMDTQVRTLAEVLDMYREYSRVGSVDSLKKYAVKWTQMLDDHTRSARTVRGSLGA